MSLSNAVDVHEIPRLKHDEAMLIAAEENRRFRRLIDEIEPDQWDRPTDCTRWRVRDVVVHVIASAERTKFAPLACPAASSNRRLTAEIGGVHWVDGLNEAGLRARADLRPEDLPERFDTASAAAPTHASACPAHPCPSPHPVRAGQLEASRLHERHRLHARRLDPAAPTPAAPTHPAKRCKSTPSIAAASCPAVFPPSACSITHYRCKT
jgi:uncharacterized protein (TIGR03083 family)